MSVKWHGVTGLCVMGHGTDAGRTPPLTFHRACAEMSLTDGMGTQGQAGCPQPSDRGIVAQPRQKPKGRPGHSPGGCTYFLWL